MVKSHDPYLGEIILFFFFGMRKIGRLYYIGNVFYIRSSETLGIFSILYMYIYIYILTWFMAIQRERKGSYVPPVQ